MKNLILLISICSFLNVNAQRIGPEEYFMYVEFYPAIEYIENHTLDEIDPAKFKASLLIITMGYLDKEGIDIDRYSIDFVVHPINLKQADYNKKTDNEWELLGSFNYSRQPDFFKKVAKGFELLNIELNDTISLENLEVKYAEAKWLQAINETEKAERIFAFIEDLKIQDDRLRFIHASRLRLAQIKFKKGLNDEALNLLYKVNDKELLRFSPDVHYDSGFDYNRTEPSKRLINYIKETEK
ncbi:hypothetical protein [Flavobacterium macacae]|uniref:Uncharacterized protein n=1 Tax=Flavobacterium macacae TaxID=2488993 RepID=A0A3P3WCK5_9FLAO|nr:hypothetical protein [Flavobacterium macacae]RRJ92895.1 hypothetical protein EG849_04715 [Flavobacterium macacae]